MPYAIMQRELAAPPLDQLADAFRVLPTLTALDAQTAVNDAFGILLRGLELESASALHAALVKKGLETEVIEESALPVLPPARIVKQVDFTPGHLVAYDPMGRRFNISTNDILLIAAGRVRLPEYKKSHTPAEAAKHSQDFLQEGRSRDSAQFHLMLEIVLAGGVGRYSLIADEFVFNHLGARLTNDLAQNFCLLVRDLAEIAPHAGLNRGAFLICDNVKEIFAYPNKAAFLEELTWFLWLTSRAVEQ